MGTLDRDRVLQIVKAAQVNGKRPDLSGADLSEADLSGAYLSQVYFIGAFLSRANLNQANLIGAHLNQADLSRAFLRRARLGEAFLSQANLGQANLSGAHLSQAHLIGAMLNEADLQDTNLNQANLGGADLSGACLAGSDLSQAALIWAGLSEANLSGANLSQADLSEAELTHAILTGANLSETDLFRVDLTGADLSKANLSETDLTGANLSGVNLTGANFCRTKLTEADVSGAVIGLTSFGDVDLSGVKGLDSVIHCGPSTVGSDTLFQSQGQIPMVFLRGCGLSDVQIESHKLNSPDLTFDQIAGITGDIQELLAEPPANYACFIRYAGEDEVFAQQLHDDLQQAGIRCWLSPGDVRLGDNSIRFRHKVLLLLSKVSIKRGWTEKEVEAALQEEDRRGKTVLFPLQLDETILETSPAWVTVLHRTRDMANFSRWQDAEIYQESFLRLLQVISQTAEG